MMRLLDIYIHCGGHIYSPWWIYMPSMVNIYAHHGGYISLLTALLITIMTDLHRDDCRIASRSFLF